jgi:hypothetical protein
MGVVKFVRLRQMYDGKVKILRPQFSYVGAIVMYIPYFNDFTLQHNILILPSYILRRCIILQLPSNLRSVFKSLYKFML